jgi:hypothetical protein
MNAVSNAASPGAPGSPLSQRRLAIVAACRACDLPVLDVAASQFSKVFAVDKLWVIAPNSDCSQIRSRLSNEARVVPEDEFIAGMTLAELRKLPVSHFPTAAGWYFQQLLKLQFAFVETTDDYYLVWDADTVPLRPMTFFDASGRMLLTKTTEYHPPYFDTYRRLLGEEPNREYSFITQHMLIQKSIAREMLTRIEEHVKGDGNWAWKIMRSLPNSGDNLFSEYETYGHYVKNHYAERIAIVERSWSREYKLKLSREMPSQSEIKKLAREFDFMAFEKPSKSWWRFLRSMQTRLTG